MPDGIVPPASSLERAFHEAFDVRAVGCWPGRAAARKLCVSFVMAEQVTTERCGVPTIEHMYVIGYQHSRRDEAHATPSGSDLALCGSLVTKLGGPWPAIESVWLDGARRCDDCARRAYRVRVGAAK